MNHVLLVEDSPSQAQKLTMELARHGIQVEIAQTGLEGVSSAREHPPVAIVLDIELPDLDGYAVCSALKADPRTARIPIILLTRRDTSQDAVRGLSLGAVDYIPKDIYAEYNLVMALQHLGVV